VLIAAGIMLAAGCSDGGGAGPGGAAPPFDVAMTTLELVDTTRPTAATQTTPGSPSRAIATDVYYPLRDGRSPIVLLSHGLRSHPARFAHVLEALARAGYVAVAPAYPLTSSSAPDGGDHADDVVNQPADASFVIGEIIRLGDAREGDGGDAKAGDLAGRVDGDRVALLGSSLGAITSLGVSYGRCCRDDRIDAVISISGFLFPFPGGFDVAGVPALFIHGDRDDTIPYSLGLAAYQTAAPPKWLVTNLGGGHGIEEIGFDTADPRSDFDEFFAIVLDFLDLYARGDRAAADRLVADGAIPGRTTLTYEESGS